MDTLFLDLASHTGLIAAATDDHVLAQKSVDRRVGDHELMPLVEHILVQAKWEPSDLTRLACVVGPGGFMSLRVAVSLANAFAWGLNIPSAGIHLSDLYRARAEHSSVFWLHSTKRDSLFIRELEKGAKRWPEPTLITRKELEKFSKESRSWMGELIAEHRSIIDAAGWRETPLMPLDEILPSFLESQDYRSEILLPWYGREG